MDALHINKEFANLTEKEFKLAIKTAAQQVTSWTRRELSRLLITHKTPLVLPLKNGGYIIGRHQIFPKKGIWVMQDHNQENQYFFDNKQSAVFYCLCDQANAFKLAREIMEYDREVLQKKVDMQHYKRSLDRAIKKKNAFGIDIWWCRYADAKIHLEHAQTQLKKSIKTAKYNKVGEI